MVFLCGKSLMEYTYWKSFGSRNYWPTRIFQWWDCILPRYVPALRLNLNHFHVWAFRPFGQVFHKCFYVPKSEGKVYKMNIGLSIWNLLLLLWIYSSQNCPSLQIQHLMSCILPKGHFLSRDNFKIYLKWNEGCEWSGTI